MKNAEIMKFKLFGGCHFIVELLHKSYFSTSWYAYCMSPSEQKIHRKAMVG